MEIRIEPFDPKWHKPGTVSHTGADAWMGRDSCSQPAEFSVYTERHGWFSVCGDHLAYPMRAVLR